jgi:hypothetical protein
VVVVVVVVVADAAAAAADAAGSQLLKATPADHAIRHRGTAWQRQPSTSMGGRER